MTATCHLHALSAYAPDTVLTNDDLAKLVDTNDEWIVARTGIKQRRKLADTDNASDLGLVAARRALENAGINRGRPDPHRRGHLHAGPAFPFRGLHSGRKAGRGPGHGL